MTDEFDPAALFIYAATTPVGGTCGVVPVAGVLKQTSTQVTVVVGLYGDKIIGNVACADDVSYDRKLRITLQAPLRDRALLDGGDHDKARPVLDAATLPKLTKLPPGYALKDTYPPRTSPGATMAFVRDYADRWGSTLQVALGPAGTTVVAGQPRGTTQINGATATYGWTTGFEQDISISWSDHSRELQLYQMSVYEHAHPPLTLQQLERLATSTS